MTDKFERQLDKLLNGVNKELDGLPDDEQEECQQVEDLTPVIYDKKETNLAVQDDSQDLLEDYEFARSNLYGLIGDCNAGVKLILKIAQMSEHPRAVEVASNLIKTSADITKTLVDLQKNVADITKTKEGKPSSVSNTQINNYYTPKEVNDDLDGLDDDDDIEADTRKD